MEIEEVGIDWGKHIRDMIRQEREDRFYKNIFDSLFGEAQQCQN